MLRIARYLGAGLAVLIALAIVGIGAYTHTDAFRELARQKLLAAVNDTVRGKISIARLEGSVWGNLVLVDVRVTYEGAEIARIARLRINPFLLPLLWKRVQLFRLVAEQPALQLREDKSGIWNIVEAFSPAQPASGESSHWAVSLNSLQLEQGNITISTNQGDAYRLQDLNLRGNLGLALSGMTLNVSELSSRVQMDGTPETRIRGSLTYRNPLGSSANLEARHFSIESGSSKLSLTGKIKDLKSLDSEARVSIEQITPEDAARFVPQWPVKSKVSGTVNIKGPLNALAGELSLATAEGKIGAKFHAALAGDRPRYQASVAVDRVNINKLLGRRDLAGIVTARVEANGIGFDLKGIGAEGDGRVESGSIAQWQFGEMLFSGKLQNRVATATGEIKGELGHAEWNGQIALDRTPRYQLKLLAERLDIQKLSPEGKRISGTLNLKARVDGSGFTLAGMKAQADVDLLPSTIGQTNIDRGKIIASVAGERVRISEASLKGRNAALYVNGDMGLNPKQQGQVNYRLDVGNVSPWLELLGRKGSGSVNIKGHARGNLSELRTEGVLAANSVDFENTAIRRASVNYGLNYSDRKPAVQGKFNFDFSDVRSAYRLQELAGAVTVLPKSPYAFEVRARARDAQSRTDSVAVTLEYQPGNIIARVSELSLNLPDGTWRLAQPVTIAQRQQDFFIERLTMSNNDRQIFIDGRFSLTGNQGLRMTIERLPIESIRNFFPVKADITGLLSAQAQLSGTAAAPQFSANAKLENSKIAGQSYASLSAALRYRGRAVELNATLRQDQQRELTANGTVPMAISWQNGWHAGTSGALNGRIQSSGLSLAFLNAFAGKAVQGIDGELSLDVRLRGTIDHPLADGFVRLRDGKLAPTALGIQVTRITLDGIIEPRGVRIQRLSARAADGELNGSGVIVLTNFSPQSLEFSVAAKRWPAINTQRYKAVIDGALNVNGTIKAPRVSGKIDVLNGELRPDLAFLEHGTTPAKRDPTITVVPANYDEGSGTEKSNAAEKTTGTDLLRNTTLNLRIHIPNNLWVRHDNANAELSGDVQVAQTPGGKPILTGRIETVRGWVGFQGRRFTLTQGSIEFTGGDKVNPSLDIAAEYRVTSYLVKASVTGTVAKPALTLASDPQLDQADILSLLLFNKPMSALGQGEQMSLQQNAIDITSGFAASTIGAAVSKALGLQNLGVDLGDVNYSGGQVKYGRYVSSNTFVAVGEDVTGKTGQEASAEYQITPEWKLDVTTSTKGANGIDIIWHKRY